MSVAAVIFAHYKVIVATGCAESSIYKVCFSVKSNQNCAEYFDCGQCESPDTKGNTLVNLVLDGTSWHLTET